MVIAEAAVQITLLDRGRYLNWRVTMLDSAVPGSGSGYLQDDQLQLLARRE